MKTFLTQACFFLLSMGLFIGLNAQHNTNSGIWFTPNNGQWHENVEYQLNVPSGKFILEKNRFLVHFIERGESHPKTNATKHAQTIKHHTYAVEFLGANPNPVFETEKVSSFHTNFFLGSDPTRWASKVHAYRKVRYKGLYDGINLEVHGKHQNLKYDFVVEPQEDPGKIQLHYQGMSDLYLDGQGLNIKTTLANVLEKKPIAYQYVEGLYTPVPCQFVLENNTITFAFPEGYDKTLPLIIDPELEFSSFTGSTAGNFGNTASYDNDGNLYGGGSVFGSGYPTTVGAFQEDFNNGINNNVDIGITKFSPDGSELIYSTYLGGGRADIPISLVVNDNNELYVLGYTSSEDFPTSADAFDPSYNGGTQFPGSTIQFRAGTDIGVTKFDATGTLMASTYVGGSGNDGVNTVNNLIYNYGDDLRGEIILTETNSCLLVSSTHSTDFPKADQGFQTTSGGQQDGVIVELDANLTDVLWSSYLGGNQNDIAYAVQQDSQGNIYVAGGTTSTNFPSLNGVNVSLHGDVDGFLTKLNRQGSALLSSTYVGTDDYDQAYFVQLDQNDFPYVFGQTEGKYPTSQGVYQNSNSGQFIHKFSKDLGSTEFSTVIGTGSGKVDISPSAFMIDNCNRLYICGWGGEINRIGPNSGAKNSTTTGLPITQDAYQVQTDGSDFYFAVFEENMAGIEYASFFGGMTNAEHVDGGTCRFDKRGYVYQTVCTGCYGSSDFPTTPEAWSETSGSFECNMAAFKFGLSQIEPVASTPDANLCQIEETEFINNSEGGDLFFWDFGDGSSSSEHSPTHQYADTGTYTVTLTVADSKGCLLPATTELIVQVIAGPEIEVPLVDSICPGDTAFFEVSGGDAYTWASSPTLSSGNAQTNYAWPSETTSYQVVASDECGTDTSEVIVPVFESYLFVSPETKICEGDSVQLFATGGESYNWSPSESLSDPTSASPYAKPSQTTLYTVESTTNGLCLEKKNIMVIVVPQVIDPILNADTVICKGESIIGLAAGAETYSWVPQDPLDDPLIANPIITPDQTTTFWVEFTNICTTAVKSFTVEVEEAEAQVSPMQYACPGDTVELWATGGIVYSWSPEELVSDAQTSNPYVVPEEASSFSVVVTDEKGCTDTAYTSVELYASPFVNAGIDQKVTWGEEAQLEAITGVSGTFFWFSSDTTMSCVDCYNPVVQPQESSTYIVHFTDENGCRASDSVNILVEGTLFVPNSFTPNGDGINDYFKAEGKELKEFDMWIFDRWGQLIFTSNNLAYSWDGKFHGQEVQIDTYVWKIKYKDSFDRTGTLYGHVNVLK